MSCQMTLSNPLTRPLPRWLATLPLLLLLLAALWVPAAQGQQPSPLQAAQPAHARQQLQAQQVTVQAQPQPLQMSMPAQPQPQAQQQQAADITPTLATDTQAWLDQAVAATRPSGAAPLRMEVSVGALDARLRLAPCSRVEPYVPPGLRLWGKTRLGLRCVDGSARWNVFLPIQVKAFGQAWVVKRDVASGAVLNEEDAMLAEVDWADERFAVLADPADWLGQTATRALATGQTLRQGMVRPAQVFQAGAQVRVVAQGPGFQITSDGQAVSAGVVGAVARVRIDNGRVLSGVVLDVRTVKVEL